MRKIPYIIIAVLFLYSCGSLKKNKESTNEKTESSSSTNTELNYEINSFTLEPVDLDRPILVGGKEYHNTKIVIQKENGKEVKQEEKKEVEEKKEEKKDIERDNTWLIIVISALILLFLFGLFIFGYLYFKIKKP